MGIYALNYFMESRFSDYSARHGYRKTVCDAEMMIAKTACNTENAHMILNKDGYVFTRICFEDSLRLFTLAYTE
jgi:hypothetical protein